MSRSVILYQHSWRLYFHITCLQYIQCIFIIFIFLASCLCLYFHDTCLILLQPKLREAKGMSYNSFFWPFAINSNPLQVFSFYCPFGKLSFCWAPAQSVYENCHYKSVCARHGPKSISEKNEINACLKVAHVHFIFDWQLDKMHLPKFLETQR